MLTLTPEDRRDAYRFAKSILESNKVDTLCTALSKSLENRCGSRMNIEDLMLVLPEFASLAPDWYPNRNPQVWEDNLWWHKNDRKSRLKALDRCIRKVAWECNDAPSESRFEDLLTESERDALLQAVRNEVRRINADGRAEEGDQVMVHGGMYKGKMGKVEAVSKSVYGGVSASMLDEGHRVFLKLGEYTIFHSERASLLQRAERKLSEGDVWRHKKF